MHTMETRVSTRPSAYSAGGRTDVAVFQQLYGIHPSIIQYVDENVLRLLNIHASDISSKFKVVTPCYEEVFRYFISVKMSKFPNSILTK